jgi:hypothetical protein
MNNNVVVGVHTHKNKDHSSGIFLNHKILSKVKINIKTLLNKKYG